MRIKSIWVNNFKSLVDFKIDLANFNCLIGLNGSGKSTFLQFMDFLAQLMTGGMSFRLPQRNWTKENIVTRFDKNKRRTIKFKVIFQKDHVEGFWEGDFLVDLLSDDQRRVDILYCVQEKFSWDDCSIEVTNDPKNVGTCVWNDRKDIPESRKVYEINFKYQGSIFSALADHEVLAKFGEVIEFFRNIRTFDLLSPNAMKKDSTASYGTIGNMGENIAHFLDGMDPEAHSRINEKIKRVYPRFHDFDVRDSTNFAGGKTLYITENYCIIENDRRGHLPYYFQAKEINDGLLRILAILGQLSSNDPFLLFDEIENGINPELVGFLLDQFTTTEKQIVVTTHNPLILNYLNDETAIPGIHFFYKTPEGFTQTRQFLAIPEMREKLDVMGPGEVMIDTNLTELASRLSQQ